MKRIYSARNLPEAHLLLHLLGHEGIRARVVGEHLQGAMGEIPFPEVYPEIWIEREHDAARALRIVSEFEHGADDARTVRCLDCGEDNPRNFQICWSCGESLLAL